MNAQEADESKGRRWFRIRRRRDDPFGEHDEDEIEAESLEAAQHWDDGVWVSRNDQYRPGGKPW